MVISLQMVRFLACLVQTHQISGRIATYGVQGISADIAAIEHVLAETGCPPHPVPEGTPTVGPHGYVHHLVQQRARSVFAEHWPVGMQVQRLRRREAAAPHRVAGADDEQPVRKLWKDVFECREGPAQEGEDVLASQVMADRAGNRDLGVGDSGPADPDFPQCHPSRRAVEVALGVPDEVVAVVGRGIRRDG